jgi:nitroimidazol reductase NimA-like FMN-containing flavoprotein (pyridoxamine 5'-phosphate oxidase superfamily)
MRRREREIRDEAGIQDILEKGLVCRLGLYDGKYPYVVPMNYGCRNGRLYFHCAGEGRKIDILKKNDRVCIEVDIDSRIVRGDAPCRWTTKYRSVIGYGTARIVEDVREKKAALDVIMAHYGGKGGEYDEKSLGLITVIEVVLESMTGKQSL